MAKSVTYIMYRCGTYLVHVLLDTAQKLPENFGLDQWSHKTNIFPNHGSYGNSYRKS